jgi:hypothetical protein
VVIGTEPRVLREIHGPGVNLVLWRRPAEPRIAAEVAGLAPGALPDVRAEVQVETAEGDVRGVLARQGLPPGALDHWEADMVALIRRFAPLAAGHPIHLRLETLDGDGCRRFHVDRCRLRLLCTYRGPGTEWLPNRQVDREALYQHRPNEEVLAHGAPERMEPFSVGVMKGESYPGNEGNGLVHRSPPVSGTGHTRVLLCLDC